jgi:hypothetical protein
VTVHFIVHLHDRAGQRCTVTPRQYRSSLCGCGSCGAQWEAMIDVRARPYALECPKCGRNTGLEMAT